MLRAIFGPAALLVAALLAGQPRTAAAGPLALTGVNLAGAEFGALPGRVGTDYFYPSLSDVNELLLRRVGIFRLPFRWERLQHSLNGPLDPDEQSQLTAAVTAITSRGAQVIVSPHNYARYNDKVIGSPDVPVAAYADFWRKTAALFRDNSLVSFGLMNEPHDLPTGQWRDAANAAIQAIRDAGASNLIMVPGSAWTGGHSWTSPDYGVSNAKVMGSIRDPDNNFVYEIHQYFDADSSGTHPTCSDATHGEQALKGVTDWLKQQNKKGFLAEFGSTGDAVCLQAMENALYFLEDNPDAWLGWTYWGAGSWWGGNPLSAQPLAGGVNPPQMTVLMRHMSRN